MKVKGYIPGKNFTMGQCFWGKFNGRVRFCDVILYEYSRLGQGAFITGITIQRVTL